MKLLEHQWTTVQKLKKQYKVQLKVCVKLQIGIIVIG